FSPEIPGRRIGEAKPEWEIPMLIAERAKPASAGLIHFENAQAIRDEIGRIIPAYAGIEQLQKAGDQIQWGGERLCETHNDQGETSPYFPTANGRAKFSTIEIEERPRDGRLRLATRRGKQFNSMVHQERDPLNGSRREDILISQPDAQRLGLSDGDAIIVRSETGALRGRCRIAPITPGNVQAHWPEGNVLVKRGVWDPDCGVPDYNAWVEIERLEKA
ncbi:MAG: formate dehydrogenase, partial [Blastocatellia bacterium]|nr:formate dehydrogenase [Blastocatellia bacterium]